MHIFENQVFENFVCAQCKAPMWQVKWERNEIDLIKKTEWKKGFFLQYNDPTKEKL